MLQCYVTCYVARKELKVKKYVRKVTRVGKRSLSIVIPADIVEELGIRERQKLTLIRRGSKIVVEDWDPTSK